MLARQLSRNIWQTLQAKSVIACKVLNSVSIAACNSTRLRGEYQCIWKPLAKIRKNLAVIPIQTWVCIQQCSTFFQWVLYTTRLHCHSNNEYQHTCVLHYHTNTTLTNFYHASRILSPLLSSIRSCAVFRQC